MLLSCNGATARNEKSSCKPYCTLTYFHERAVAVVYSPGAANRRIGEADETNARL
jgi:hypothetical protein